MEKEYPKFNEILSDFEEFYSLQLIIIKKGFKEINNDECEFEEIFDVYLPSKALLEQKYANMHVYSFTSLFFVVTSICLMLVYTYLKLKERHEKKSHEFVIKKYLLRQKTKFRFNPRFTSRL